MKTFTIWDRIRGAIYTVCFAALALWAAHAGKLEYFLVPVAAALASLMVNLEVTKRRVKCLEGSQSSSTKT